MGIEAGKYTSFSMLKKRVIDTAIVEINEKTDLKVSYGIEKIGRSVNSIEFKMNLKKHRLDLFPDSVEIKKKLQYFGIKDKQIESLLKKHDQQYLWANIEVVEQEAKKGSIKNLAAYLLKAFEDDYRPLETEFSKLQKQEIAEKEAKSLQQEQEQIKQEERLEQFEKWKKITLLQRLSTMPDEEKEALKNAFILEIETKDFALKMLQIKGFENPIIQ